MVNPVEFSKELIRCPSITPEEGGALDTLQAALESLGFACERIVFSDENTPDVDNLYAKLGDSAPNICFAGHTDVVPPGDLDAWNNDPFDPIVKDGVLYGRGASDMKCSIAAWVAAVAKFLEEGNKPSGSISLLITGDEEGPAINGTQKVLKWMEEKGEKIDACIVGEPTNPDALGDMIKIGRRGSVNFVLEVHGVQGHVAYPQRAETPMPKMLEILDVLNKIELDSGTDHFDPSNLEITSIYSSSDTSNVIPASVTAKINIRFNDTHTASSLAKMVEDICERHAGSKFSLEVIPAGEAFYTPPGEFTDLVAKAVKTVTGKDPELSTTGGTSDARYIKDYCGSIVELGLINETAHKVDENALVEDIEQLTDIYKEILKGY